jgi:hypothetical protein
MRYTIVHLKNVNAIPGKNENGVSAADFADKKSKSFKIRDIKRIAKKIATFLR